MSIGWFARKVATRVLPNLHNLQHSQIRRCRACEQLTVFVALGRGDEFRLCVRCRANLRFEMLATHIRKNFPALGNSRVLELGFGSPISRMLRQAGQYTPSFYSKEGVPGQDRGDGVVQEDIMNLSFADETLDLIVSSDVLEHVPDLEKAFRETARVLKPGGIHVFTVPPRARTVRRAEFGHGGIEHLLTPEYHRDPLNTEGILAFWDCGLDLGQVVSTPGLKILVVAGPEGKDARVVWEARKIR